MSYQRVIPRDLFNESKLLKCLGQLSLIIHDGVRVPRGLALTHDDSECPSFQIEQNQDSGALHCSNIELTCRLRLIGLQCQYNSKDAYPLLATLNDDEARVFDDNGALSQDFRSMVAGIK